MSKIFDAELRQYILDHGPLQTPACFGEFAKNILGKLCQKSKRVGYEFTDPNKNHCVGFLKSVDPLDKFLNKGLGSHVAFGKQHGKYLWMMAIEQFPHLTSQEAATMVLHEFAHVEFNAHPILGRISAFTLFGERLRNSHNIFKRKLGACIHIPLIRMQEFWCDNFVVRKSGLYKSLFNALRKTQLFDYTVLKKLSAKNVPNSFNEYCLKQILKFNEGPSFFKRTIAIVIAKLLKM